MHCDRRMNCEFSLLILYIHLNTYDYHSTHLPTFWWHGSSFLANQHGPVRLVDLKEVVREFEFSSKKDYGFRDSEIFVDFQAWRQLQKRTSLHTLAQDLHLPSSQVSHSFIPRITEK